MANVMIARDDGSVQRNATQAAMADAYGKKQGIVWLDLGRPPNADEQPFLKDLLGIGDGAIEHMTEPHFGPRAVRFHSYLLVVLFEVELVAEATEVEKDELVLLVGERYLLSVHNAKATRLAQVAEHLEESLDRFGIETGAVVVAILEAVVDQYLRTVKEVRHRVDALEDRVLNQQEPEAITELYQFGRELTVLRRVISPEDALVGSLQTPSSPGINAEIGDALLDIKHDMQRAVDEIDQYQSMLPDILNTFESLKSDSLNRIVKLLTVWSIILTAVALFPTVMGISLAREPSISPFSGYVISIGMMALVGVLIWYIFKRRGWTD